MTKLQENKYWREWSQASKAQGWRTGAEKDAARKFWHAKLKLPESHKHWTNDHFSVWISGTAHLRNVVDVRDRTRDSMIWTIERLQAGFKTLLGHDYARAIMLMWADSDDLEKFPLKSADKLDLENLRNTLKNRIGRVIARLQAHELEKGPDCPSLEGSQAEIIAVLISDKKPATARKSYTLDSNKTFKAGAPSAGLIGEAGPSPLPPAGPIPARPVIPRPKPAPVAPAPAPAGARKYCMHPGKKFTPKATPAVAPIEDHVEDPF